MSVRPVFRLATGDRGPIQQSRVSCGSACLTVARMMIDPGLTRWIRQGRWVEGEPTDPRAMAERFGEHERAVLARTNAASWRGAAVHPPWPQALGTPPWGALRELESGAAVEGTRYTTTLLRHLQSTELVAAASRLLASIDVGAPLLLYVGNAVLPRHVTLAFTGEASRAALYDPGTGRVEPFPVDLGRGRLCVSGWDRAWLAVHPLGQVRAHGGALAGETARHFSSPALCRDSA